jgi:hypothetical protein
VQGRFHVVILGHAASPKTKKASTGKAEAHALTPLAEFLTWSASRSTNHHMRFVYENSENYSSKYCATKLLEFLVPCWSHAPTAMIGAGQQSPFKRHHNDTQRPQKVNRITQVNKINHL